MNRPRVLIADDHQILAEGVRSLLEPDFAVVGIVADGRELVVAARRLQPDVIVADITMPALKGIEAAVQLREARVTSKVVF
jgi:DNA-binding NarL/FixJ family response regulator